MRKTREWSGLRDRDTLFGGLTGKLSKLRAWRHHDGKKRPVQPECHILDFTLENHLIRINGQNRFTEGLVAHDIILTVDDGHPFRPTPHYRLQGHGGAGRKYRFGSRDPGGPVINSFGEGKWIFPFAFRRIGLHRPHKNGNPENQKEPNPKPGRDSI